MNERFDFPKQFFILGQISSCNDNSFMTSFGITPLVCDFMLKWKISKMVSNFQKFGFFENPNRGV